MIVKYLILNIISTDTAKMNTETRMAHVSATHICCHSTKMFDFRVECLWSKNISQRFKMNNY